MFAVAFASGTVLLAELWGSFGDPDGAFADFYDDATNRGATVVGSALLFVSGLTLLPFAAGLAGRIDRGAGPWQQMLAQLPVVVSVLIVAAAAASATVGASRTMAVAFDEASEPFEGPGTAVLPQLGYVLIVLAAWAEAVWLLVAGTLAVRSGAKFFVAGWPAVACAAALILSPAVMPLLVLPVWVLAASVSMLRARASGGA